MGRADGMVIGLRHWLFAEELCDQDMATHALLQELFPSDSAWKKAKRLRNPLMQSTDNIDYRDFTDDAVGETLDDIAKAVGYDEAAPTEQHQREVMRIHRNLGHPDPHTLARAL